MAPLIARLLDEERWDSPSRECFRMWFLLLTVLRDRIAGTSVAWKMSKTKGDMLAGNGTQKGQDEKSDLEGAAGNLADSCPA